MFLPVRAKAIKNMEKQVFSDKKLANLVSPRSVHQYMAWHGSGLSHKLEMNVRSQVQELELSSITASNTYSS